MVGPRRPTRTSLSQTKTSHVGDVDAFALDAVQSDDFGGPIIACAGNPVRGHGVELGRFPRSEYSTLIRERQIDRTVENVEPFAAWMRMILRRTGL